MSKNKTTHALLILNESVRIAPAVQISNLARQARDELQEIQKMEGAAALRALRFGIVMHHMKAKLKHGEFMPWIAKNFEGRQHRQCNYYMRLAIVFAEKMRLNAEEAFALPGAQLELSLDDQQDTTRSVLEKAQKFIGELSLNELLIKHDIKAVGLKKELSEGESEEEETDLPPDEAVRRRRDAIFGQTAEYLHGLRKTLTNAEELTLLDHTQRDHIRRELRELNACLDALTA